VQEVGLSTKSNKSTLYDFCTKRLEPSAYVDRQTTEPRLVKLVQLKGRLLPDAKGGWISLNY